HSGGLLCIFFFQAEDGIRDWSVTGVQTCALPISGQAAFSTIGEVVAILKADSSTDWSKVDLDALREHLIDMDDVVMHASVAKRRSEERRVGKECRSRWAAEDEKKKRRAVDEMARA